MEPHVLNRPPATSVNVLQASLEHNVKHVCINTDKSLSPLSVELSYLAYHVLGVVSSNRNLQLKVGQILICLI